MCNAYTHAFTQAETLLLIQLWRTWVVLRMSPAPRSSRWSDGAWVSWGANWSPDADRWFAMTRYLRFVT